jgi:hypothetical protein
MCRGVVQSLSVSLYVDLTRTYDGFLLVMEPVDDVREVH